MSKVISIRIPDKIYDIITEETKSLNFDFKGDYLKVILGIDEPGPIKFDKSKHDQEIVELIAFVELFPYAIMENLKTAMKHTKSTKKREQYKYLLMRYTAIYNSMKRTNTIYLDAINQDVKKLEYGLNIVEAFGEFISNHSNSKSKIKKLLELSKK